jgi:hypothetical protein
MTNKFSFLLLIAKDGIPSAKIYKKEDAQKGINDFNEARAKGSEAYWFQSPRADKRCKSEASREELRNSIQRTVSEEVKPQVEVKSEKLSKKQSKVAEGIADLD